jgi:hypothetical protein
MFRSSFVIRNYSFFIIGGMSSADDCMKLERSIYRVLKQGMRNDEEFELRMKN